MSDYLLDANVVLDIATTDRIWAEWSEGQLLAAVEKRGRVIINPLIYAEISQAFASASELDLWVRPSVFHRVALPYEAAWLAGQAFVKYRRAGGVRTSPLPDFYIGAHAEVEGLTLVTRDAGRYRTYFPGIRLVCP